MMLGVQLLLSPWAAGKPHCICKALDTYSIFRIVLMRQERGFRAISIQRNSLVLFAVRMPLLSCPKSDFHSGQSLDPEDLSPVLHFSTVSPGDHTGGQSQQNLHSFLSCLYLNAPQPIWLSSCHSTCRKALGVLQPRAFSLLVPITFVVQTSFPFAMSHLTW